MTSPSKMPTYRSWANMHSRCSNPRDIGYRHYGGRGICVCEEWATFQGFVADMGERPVGLTLERKDLDKGYSKANCTWATPREQTLNRSNTVWITLDGRTQCLLDWCRQFGISHQVALWRHNHGWSWEHAITTPTKGANHV